MQYSITPKTYFILFLASIFLISTSLEVYILWFNPELEIWPVMLLNIILALIVNEFGREQKIEQYLENWNNEEYKSYRYDDDYSIEKKYIFFIQSLIVFHLFFFSIIYFFFSIQRSHIYDLIIMLLITLFLVFRGKMAFRDFLGGL